MHVKFLQWQCESCQHSIHTHTHTHRQTQTHRHTDTDTQTHTHTPAPARGWWQPWRACQCGAQHQAGSCPPCSPHPCAHQPHTAASQQTPRRSAQPRASGCLQPGPQHGPAWTCTAAAAAARPCCLTCTPHACTLWQARLHRPSASPQSWSMPAAAEARGRTCLQATSLPSHAGSRVRRPW